MLVRLTGKSSAFRNALIERMADDGVATNVHYKPLPLLTAYRDLGFAIADFPNALAQFENEATLPLHTLLSDEDVDVRGGIVQARPGRTRGGKASADVREFRKTRVRHRRRAGGAALRAADHRGAGTVHPLRGQGPRLLQRAARRKRRARFQDVQAALDAGERARPHHGGRLHLQRRRR